MSGWLAVEDLTASEAALVAAVLAHRWWKPVPVFPEEVTDPPQDADWRAERTVRAQVLYQLLTGQGPPSVDGAGSDVAPRTVRMRGARIVGQLDLEAATLRCPLELVGCWLDHGAGPVLLREATAPVIRLRGCWLPAGLDARQLTTRGDVDFRRCRIQGEVWLDGGRVGGALDLTGGKFRNKGGLAIHADRMQVDQGLFCRDGFEVDGEVSFFGGHVAMLGLSGKFRNHGGTALHAEVLKVDQEVFCRQGFEADGKVSFADGHVGGLDLTGKFRNQGGTAFDAGRLQVDGNVFCRQGFEADGKVSFADGHVGGLDLTGKFSNQGGTALDAGRLQVDGNAFCRQGFEADGEIRLLGGQIGGQLELTGRFRNEGGRTLDADHVRVERSVHWWPAEVKGRATFAFGSVGVWVDRPAVLDIPVYLHGLRYHGLYPVPPKVTASQRIAWLNLDPGYSPQPYSQLASVYRAEGHDRAARQVFIASQTRRRRQVSGWRGLPGRAWGGLLWATVGYGYRPWLALLWLVALIVGGSLVVDALPDRDYLEGSGAPGFNALLYTVDVLLPFVDVGYDKWVAVDVAQTVTVVLVVFGWVLATAVIAAFAGVLRRGD